MYEFFLRRIAGHKDWNITQRKYSSILKDINSSIVDHIVVHPGTYVNLPCNMGELTIRTKVRKMFNIDGKLNTRLPIDRKKTFEMWNKNPEAKEKRIFIRILDPNRHIFVWVTNRCIVKNKSSYHFIMLNAVTMKLYRHILSMNRDIMYPIFGYKSAENIEYNKLCAKL
jgi:hypothetical protein